MVNPRHRRSKSLYPYAGTSGWSGSSASRDRAIEADRSGVTRERHQLTMGHLATANSYGLTWFELCDTAGWHHGEASGALTRAHRIGEAARLVERRGTGKGSHVYVRTDHVDGRETEAYRPKPRMQLLRDVYSHLLDGDSAAAMELLEEVLDPIDDPTPKPRSKRPWLR